MEVLESNRASANRGYWWGRVNHWNPASGNSEAHTSPSFFILRHSHLIPPISHLIPIISYPKTHVVPSTLYCEVLLGFKTPLHQQALSKFQVTKVTSLQDGSLRAFFLLARSCFLITLTNSLKLSQRSWVSRVALWRCSRNIFFFDFVIAVFMLFRSCLLITLVKCLEGHKSLRVLTGKTNFNNNTKWVTLWQGHLLTWSCGDS